MLWSHLKPLSFIVCITFYSINCIILSKKTSLFWFCNFLCLDDLRICFYLNKHKPCLELFFKFNQCRMRPFQRALVGFNNLYIHWSSREFNWVYMSKIPSPHFQMESWAIVLSMSSLINFRIVYIWPMYQILDKWIWLTILLFFYPKESCTLFEILIFLGGAPTSMSLFPSIRPSVAYHISGTIHHLIIILGTHV